VRKKILILLILILASGGGVYWWFHHKHKTDHEFIAFGNVDIRQVDLGFRVYGRVVKLYFDEGDLVVPGALMAELDPVPYQEKVREAEAAVVTIRKRLDNAQLVFERRMKTVGSGAVSQEVFDDAKANVEELTAQLEQAEASLALAKTNLGDTKMYAPSRGTILTRIREPGSVVDIGQPVFTLSIESPVWIRTFVSEPQLGLVKPGMEALITTDTPGGHPYKGHVGFISPVAEFTPKSVETLSLRTDLVYRLRVIVDDPDGTLKQGMPVTVEFML
jgi:HlyD family secretion protein